MLNLFIAFQPHNSRLPSLKGYQATLLEKVSHSSPSSSSNGSMFMDESSFRSSPFVAKLVTDYSKDVHQTYH